MNLDLDTTWLPEEHTPCYGLPSLFEATDPASHRVAKAHCSVCPVRLRCLTEARRELDRGHPTGTWGGVLFGVQGRKAAA